MVTVKLSLAVEVSTVFSVVAASANLSSTLLRTGSGRLADLASICVEPAASKAVVVSSDVVSVGVEDAAGPVPAVSVAVDVVSGNWTEVVLIEVSMVRPLAVVTSEVVTSDVATPDNLSAASLAERSRSGSDSAAGLTTRSGRSEGSNVVVDSPEVFSDADDNVVLPVPE